MKKIIALLLTLVLTLSGAWVSSFQAAAAENIFNATIYVYDIDADAPVPNVDVKFVEYNKDPADDTYPRPELVQVLAEWNTSDQNPLCHF